MRPLGVFGRRVMQSVAGDTSVVVSSLKVLDCLSCAIAFVVLSGIGADHEF